MCSQGHNCPGLKAQILTHRLRAYVGSSSSTRFVHLSQYVCLSYASAITVIDLGLTFWSLVSVVIFHFWSWEFLGKRVLLNWQLNFWRQENICFLWNLCFSVVCNRKCKPDTLAIGKKKGKKKRQSINKSKELSTHCWYF